MTHADFQAARPQPASQWREGQPGATPIERITPEETAIGVSYDSEPYAVLMATPQDIADLALGFTISERVAGAADVLDIRVSAHDEGLVADVLLSREGAVRARDRRRRNMEGRSSCGLCGIQSPEDALRALPHLPPGPNVERAAIQAALAALEDGQTLGAATRATHAAAWAGLDGKLLLVREDVGRHNALDKLIGAALKAGLDPSRAFVVVTSRCSYEMVEKTVLAGVAVLVAISAPTALAIRKAEIANLTLIALARADGHAVFTGAERIIDRSDHDAPHAPPVLDDGMELFAFESDFVATLRCIPMAVRFKLDLACIKVSLRQWSRLTLADRADLLAWPCATAREIKTYRDRLVEMITLRTNEPAKPIALDVAPAWAMSDELPAVLGRYAHSVGEIPPTLQQWRSLSPLRRFTLLKLTRDGHDNVNFAPALREFGLLAHER